MGMESDNVDPITRLCLEGIRAEGEGRYDAALELYMRAWEARKDDHDACVAAHFVARQQTSIEERLRWNQVALEHANAAGDDRVQTFYPSLYLNISKAYEDLGQSQEAQRYNNLASGKVDDLPRGSLGELTRQAIAEGQKRVDGV